MAEITQRDGSWTFDGEILRIVPGHGRGVHQLRSSLGEVAVPLEAVGKLAFEQGRKHGRLRLRLRDGADPLTHVVRGRLPDNADPYQLSVDSDRFGVAEYLVDEVRQALLLDQVPNTPCDRYLLPGPSVPLTATGTDGTVTFDGDQVSIVWNWMAESSKSSGGPRNFALAELVGVEWTPATGWENGSLRFRPHGSHPSLKPDHDPNCLLLWGVRQARETGGSALLAAAVLARLPHPSAGADPADKALPSAADPALEPPAAPPQPTGDDHDVLLRRLRELAELHRDGVLTEEEFTTAKRAVIEHF